MAALLVAPLVAGCVHVQPAVLTSDFGVASQVQMPGSPTFQQMRQAGRIVIGVKDDEPYLGQLDPRTGTYQGFDVEIATLIAAKLGFPKNEIQFVPVTSANRENEIANGTVDLVVGSYSITPSRKKLVSFAGPYLRTGAGLLVRRDESDITDINHMPAGSTLCSGEGSDTLSEIGRTEHIKIQLAADYSQCVDELLAGQVAGVTTDVTLLAGYAAEHPADLKVVGSPFTTELYGVGLPLTDQALRDKIDDILQAADTDGTWQTIYNQTLGKTSLGHLSPPPIQRY